MDGDGTGSADGGPPERVAVVLVVDDDALNRRLLTRAIEQLGHRVLPAGDGREALDILGREQIDLVVLDLVMPDVDGFDVLTAMGRVPELRSIPVLVVSGVEETAAVAKAIELGAIDVLPKPFDPLLVRVRLHTALDQARLRHLEKVYLQQEVTLRQQEKLATLGRLSAGLSHELNNPAAAAQRTAQRLGDRLDALQALIPDLVLQDRLTEIIRVGDDLPAVESRAGLSSVDRLDVEEAIEQILAARSVPDPTGIAPRLAATGLDAADLDAALHTLDDHAAAVAVRWLLSRRELRGAVQQLRESTGRIADIVGALRSYSFLDRAPRQAVDVRRGLEDSLTMLAHELPDGVTVERDHDAELPAIDAYGSQLNQVWTNLIGNAIDAVGTSGTITLRTRHDGDVVVVEIADDGSGIPADLLGQVFDPFVTTKEPGKGTGLGLNISHRIVTDVHGGTLTATSRPGNTVFTARLPLHSSTPPED